MSKTKMSQEQKDAARERMKNVNEKKAVEKETLQSTGSSEKEITTPLESPGESKQKPKNDMSFVDDKVKITLHEMEGMPSHQFVGINGYSCIIEVGKEVEVPKAVLGVLNDAVINTKEYISVPNQPGAFNVKDKVIPRFAITSRV